MSNGNVADFAHSVRTFSDSARPLSGNQGRGTAVGLRKLRASNAKTLLVVDESSLASSEQMRNLLRFATPLWLLRVVLVGDEK